MYILYIKYKNFAIIAQKIQRQLMQQWGKKLVLPIHMRVCFLL